MLTEALVYRLRLGLMWCYVLRCRRGYLLIDTSYPDRFAQIQDSAAELGLDISRTRHLLLTHHYDDHTGFAAQLVSCTGCRVIAHRNAVAPLRKGASQDTMPPVNRNVKLVFAIFQLFHRHFRFPQLDLGEGDIVVAGGESDVLKGVRIHGKLMYTPGHSHDSLSQILRRECVCRGRGDERPPPDGHGPRPIYVDDMDTVHGSWQSLIERGAQVVYPSHGDPSAASELVR